jgi:hypothetical protein
MLKREEKKAAFELSVTTLIVIVLSVVLLIMGLMLIRNIFTGSIETFDVLERKTMDEINRLFTDENQKIMIYLGEDKLAPIKAGESNRGILVAARTEEGNAIEDFAEMQYKLMLDETTRTNCFNKLGAEKIQGFFADQFDEWIDSSDFQGDTGKAVIRVSVPEGTSLCSQLVKIQFRDRTIQTEGIVIGGSSFTLEVKRKGLF